MKVSLNWIRDFVDLPHDKTAADLAHDLTMTTVEVEGIDDLGRAWSDVVVGRALQAPAAGRVSCDLGSRGSVTALCASPLAPGALVAVRTGGNRPTVASPADLGVAELFDGATARLPLRLDEFGGPLGAAAAPLLGWDDIVFEIDNKSVTHRPDLWGHYGLARELAAIYDRPLRSLQGMTLEAAQAPLLGDLDSTVCRRFTAALIRNVTPGEAPLWLRSRLWRVGQRPRNLIADLTNYVMLTTGQPCHAYDAKCLTLPLSVRRAAAGESFTSLDDTTSTLSTDDFVVADQRAGVALAGVIGGKESAIGDATTEVLLEAASFDPAIVRRMASAKGLRTGASARFEKGIATQRVDETRALFWKILLDTQPGATLSAVDDRRLAETLPATIEVQAEYLRGRIGKALTLDELRAPLERLGFGVVAHDDALTVRVPDWRSTGDVSGSHDLVEEIARLQGYEDFEFHPPHVRLYGTVRDFATATERRMKEFLASTCGLQEIVTYPWVEDRFVAALADPSNGSPLRLSSPPAPDLATLRTSLLPGVVKSVVSNLRWSAEFRLFEVGVVFNAGDRKALDDPREQLPPQKRALAAAFAGQDAAHLFRDAKGVVEALARRVHVEPIEVRAGDRAPWADAWANAAILSSAGRVGSIGVMNRRVAAEAGIKRGYVAVFELQLDAVTPLPSRQNTFKRLPNVPTVDLDVSLVVPEGVTWAAVAQLAVATDPLVAEVHFIDEFRGGSVPPGHRSLTLRARLQAPDRTLTSDEANEIGAAIRASAERSLGALPR